MAGPYPDLCRCATHPGINGSEYVDLLGVNS